MRIVRIVLTNFLSYDFLDLDLTDLTIAVVTGEVGAGKSALFEAITWGLWGKANRDVVIREETDECMVQVDFVARGETCSVIRTINASGRNATLGFVVDGVNLPHHIKAETQIEIDKKIGLDYDSIIAGPFMIQGESSHLMKIGPSDRKDLLIKLFGVDRYEVYHKEASARASAHDRDAQQWRSEHQALEDIVEGSADAQAVLSTARRDLLIAIQDREQATTALAEARERQITLREQARHADTLRQTVAMVAARIESDTKEHVRVLRSISDAHTAVSIAKPTFDALPDVSEEAVGIAESVYQGLSDQLRERTGLEAKMPMLRDQHERSKKLASIVQTVPCGGEGIYATCRFLTGAPKQIEIDGQSAEILDIETRLTALADRLDYQQAFDAYQALIAQREAVERQRIQQEGLVEQWKLKTAAAKQLVGNGQGNLQRLETQIARDQSVLERSEQQLAQVASDITKVAEVETQVESLKEQVDQQTSSIDMVYQPAVARAEAQTAAIEEAREKMPALAKKIREAETKAKVYATLAKAFHRDGIPTLILENGIPVIEAHANEVLGRMPDKYLLRILTQHEKKKGGMADRVDIIVQRNNGRFRPYRNLSGGQKFRVDFALRVAQGRALAHRSGTSIDTLLLDEGWGTQDKKGIDALLESLAAVAPDFKLVLVITHQEEVAHQIPANIDVALSEEGISSLTLVA